MDRIKVAKELVTIAKELVGAAKSVGEWFKNVEPQTMEKSSLVQGFMASLGNEMFHSLDKKWDVKHEDTQKYSRSFEVSTPSGLIIVKLSIIDSYEAPKAIDIGVSVFVSKKLKISKSKVFYAKDTEKNIVSWAIGIVESGLK